MDTKDNVTESKKPESAKKPVLNPGFPHAAEEAAGLALHLNMADGPGSDDPTSGKAKADEVNTTSFGYSPAGLKPAN